MFDTHEVNAMFALFSLLMLPALLLLILGMRSWYLGFQAGNQDRIRWGKMFTMFGTIFVVILLIVSYFLKGRLPG